MTLRRVKWMQTSHSNQKGAKRMYIMDVDTLTIIQKARCSEFQQQAEQLRLLRTQNATGNASPTAATAGHKRTGVLAALQQMVMIALQTHSRAVPPR